MDDSTLLDDGQLEPHLASLSLNSQESTDGFAGANGLEELCAACWRLLNNKIEVAKPCSFKSPFLFERERSKDESRVFEEYFVHHERGGLGLRDAAARGCDLCRHIWFSLSMVEREAICQDHSNTGFEASDFVTRYKFGFSTCDMTHSKYCTMKYTIRTFNRSVVKNTEDIAICLDTPVEKEFRVMPCLDPLGRRSPKPDLSSCSTTCVAQIGKWLERCDSKHDCLGASAVTLPGTAPYPTRLIDVGTSGNPLLRLCDGKDISGVQPYLTLSHCWGKVKFFTLITSNLDELKVAITLERLPKTHQEAIELTRSLDVRYLWIDSLCIIQDSETDWAFEASRMASVYSNSYCNIAATGAVDGTRGLFFAREDEDVHPVVIRIPKKDKMSGARHDMKSISLVRSVFQHMKITIKDQELTPGIFEVFYFTDADVWTWSVPASPLGKRAWCLQERILSPRTVHFGEKQLLFECQLVYACSRFPEGVPPILIPPRESKSNRSLINAAKEVHADDLAATENAYNIWKNIVMTYSTCSLTFGKDKLVAISGIASYMEKRLHLSNYLAGVWSHRTLEQLLWQCVHDPSPDAPPPDRPENYQAPSWSWASVNSPIEFSTPRRRHLAAVVKGAIWPKDTNNGYGEVDFGVLVLRGVLIVSRAHQQLKQLSESQHGFATFLALGGSRVSVEPVFDDQQDGNLKDFACVPMVFTDKGVAGLVLLRTEAPRLETYGRPIYRRAGHFNASRAAWSRFRGRPVKLPYRLERTASGNMRQVWPNEIQKQPDFNEEDKEWAEKHAVEFLVV